MRVEIKCNTCEETLGTIEKPEVTAEDIQKYQQMMTCSQGHGEQQIDLIEEEP